LCHVLLRKNNSNGFIVEALVKLVSSLFPGGYKDFGTVANTGIGVEHDKGKNGLIEYHISRNINMSGRDIKTLETLVYVTIPKKNTPSRMKLKFVWAIWAPKDTKTKVNGGGT
jgi:hypothetical protein